MCVYTNMNICMYVSKYACIPSRAPMIPLAAAFMPATELCDTDRTFRTSSNAYCGVHECGNERKGEAELIQADLDKADPNDLKQILIKQILIRQIFTKQLLTRSDLCMCLCICGCCCMHIF